MARSEQEVNDLMDVHQKAILEGAAQAGDPYVYLVTIMHGLLEGDDLREVIEIAVELSHDETILDE